MMPREAISRRERLDDPRLGGEEADQHEHLRGRRIGGRASAEQYTDECSRKRYEPNRALSGRWQDGAPRGRGG